MTAGYRKHSLLNRSISFSITSTIETDDVDWETSDLAECETGTTSGEEEAGRNNIIKKQLIVDLLPHEFSTQPKMCELMIDQIDRFWFHDLFNTRVFDDRKDGICGFIGENNMLFSLDYDDNHPIHSRPYEHFDSGELFPNDHEQLTFQVRAKIVTLEINKTPGELGRLQEIVKTLQSSLGDDIVVSLHISDNGQLILTKRQVHRSLLTPAAFMEFAALLDVFMEQARRCRKRFRAQYRKVVFQRGRSKLMSMLCIFPCVGCSLEVERY